MRWLILAMAMMTVQTWTPDRHVHDASDVTTGTLGAARLPNPGAGTKGGVSSLTCGGTNKLSAIGTDGVPVCSADETSAGGDAFPVGSVYISVVSTNPATLLGYGTWSAFGAGRVLAGIDAGQTELDVVEETGGAKTHALTTSEMPAHTHVVTSQTATTGSATSYEHGTLDTSSAEAEATEITGSTGGGGAHNNLQPYIVVYMWKRTS